MTDAWARLLTFAVDLENILVEVEHLRRENACLKAEMERRDGELNKAVQKGWENVGLTLSSLLKQTQPTTKGTGEGGTGDP